MNFIDGACLLEGETRDQAPLWLTEVLGSWNCSRHFSATSGRNCVPPCKNVSALRRGCLKTLDFLVRVSSWVSANMACNQCEGNAEITTSIMCAVPLR